MNRDEIKSILKSCIATVTFTKVDGTTRRMLCTLLPDILPETKGTSKKPNEEVLPVWDLEKDAWRSFRIDSVIEVEPEDY